MTSPLSEYINSYLVIQSAGVPEIVEGRVITDAGVKYLVRCYLKRQDSKGTSTGADYLPGQSSSGSFFPGASGDVYLYRGYALDYAVVSSDYDPYSGSVPGSGLVWVSLASGGVPEWLMPGGDCVHVQGAETPKTGRVERSTGQYGGAQIDVVISRYIRGIPLVVRSGDLTG